MKSYSLDYIDDLYVQYVRDPASVSENWRKYFEQFLVGNGNAGKTRASSEGGRIARHGGDAQNNGSTDESASQALWLARIQDRSYWQKCQFLPQFPEVPFPETILLHRNDLSEGPSGLGDA